MQCAGGVAPFPGHPVSGESSCTPHAATPEHACGVCARAIDLKEGNGNRNKDESQTHKQSMLSRVRPQSYSMALASSLLLGVASAGIIVAYAKIAKVAQLRSISTHIAHIFSRAWKLEFACLFCCAARHTKVQGNSRCAHALALTRARDSRLLSARASMSQHRRLDPQRNRKQNKNLKRILSPTALFPATNDVDRDGRCRPE